MNVRRFAAVNTKIRVLKRGMLTYKDFIKILNKNTVKDVVEYLKNNTIYSTVIKDIDIQNINRDKLEFLLKRYMVIQFEKLSHYFTDEYKKLFKIMFIRYEIEDLKLYLRAILRKEDINKIKDLVYFSSEYGNLNHELLSSSSNIQEFVESLKGTIYYDILKNYLNEKNSKLLFYMEMNLDRFYFLMLMKQEIKLGKQDKKLFKQILGKNIDLLNIEWIYRGRKFYDLIPEELINYTILGGYKFNFNDLKYLCYLKDENKFKQAILNTKYRFLFDTKNLVDLFMERRIERYLYFESLKAFKNSQMDIMTSIAYIYLLEYEIRDLISSIECIRYKLSFDEASKYLIRKIKGSDI